MKVLYNEDDDDGDQLTKKKQMKIAKTNKM